jgi:hypothetical protein
MIIQLFIDFAIIKWPRTMFSIFLYILLAISAVEFDLDVLLGEWVVFGFILLGPIAILMMAANDLKKKHLTVNDLRKKHQNESASNH